MDKTINVTVHEGDQLRVPCSVDGTPAVTVQWDRKDSRGMHTETPVSRKSVTADGTLFFRHFQTSDCGQYICRGSNFLGSAEAVINIGMHTNGRLKKLRASTVYMHIVHALPLGAVGTVYVATTTASHNVSNHKRSHSTADIKTVAISCVATLSLITMTALVVVAVRVSYRKRLYRELKAESTLSRNYSNGASEDGRLLSQIRRGSHKSDSVT